MDAIDSLWNHNLTKSINATASLDTESDSFTEKLRLVVVASYIITCILGVFGNGLVLAIVGYYSQLRAKAYNYYIWNLAFADLLFILTMPFFCAATFAGKWLFGGFVCKVAYVLRETNRFASVFTLMALSLDRYLATYHNVERFTGTKAGIVVCFIIWTCCGAISVPFWIYAGDASLNGSAVICQVQWPHDTLSQHVAFWALFQLFVGLIIPFIIIACAYVCQSVRINYVLKNQKRSMSKGIRSSRHMTKTVLIIVVIFLICLTPYHVVEVISWRMYARISAGALASLKEKHSFVILNSVAQVLMFISSCCNPVIYGLINKEYRKLYLQQVCKSEATDMSSRTRTTSIRQSIGSMYTSLRNFRKHSIHLEDEDNVARNIPLDNMEEQSDTTKPQIHEQCDLN